MLKWVWFWLMVLMTASVCEAKQIDVFGLASTALTSSTYNVSDYPTKTLTVAGAKNSAYVNMSGSVSAWCAPTPTGPWVLCTYKVETPTSVTMTTNGRITWTDATQYVKIVYTKVRRNLAVWLGLQ